MTTLSQNISMLGTAFNRELSEAQKNQRLTVVEFVDYIKNNPNERVELIDGFIVPMTGGTSNHSLISSNCLDVKHFLRKNMPNCKARTSDFGIQTKENQVRYPDFSIACNVDGDAILTSSPIIVGEVLSTGNTKKEVSMKIDEYKNLHSVQEILIISQKTKEVTIHRRGTFFGWNKEVYTNGLIEYKSIGYSFDIEDLYVDVDFRKK